MASQIRPLTGGAWNSIALLPGNKASKTQTFGVSVPPQRIPSAVRAMNEWINSGGTGTAAARAQKTAAALGLQLQEV